MDDSAVVGNREECEWMKPDTEPETVTLQYNPETDTHLAVHDWGTDESLTATVVTAVEAISGLDSRELPPLFDCVDTDALDHIFEPRESDESLRVSGRITFPYSEFLLTIHANGEIWIRPRQEASER